MSKTNNKVSIEALIDTKNNNVRSNTQKGNYALLQHLKAFCGKKQLSVKNIDAKFALMKKIVMDFSEAVEAIFGEGACIKLFGHKYPQVVQIAEFEEDFRPVAAAIISASGLGNDLASNEANKVIAMPEA
jgi:hypothetical protein